nr:MAG TPA: hypothetical protein [Bacteriophage sp.]
MGDTTSRVSPDFFYIIIAGAGLTIGVTSRVGWLPKPDRLPTPPFLCYFSNFLCYFSNFLYLHHFSAIFLILSIP